MTHNWAAFLGKFTIDGSTLIFKGGESEQQDGQKIYAVGNFVCDKYFSGGKITADVEFQEVNDRTGCEIILFYDPTNQNFLSAGIGGGFSMYNIRSFANGRYTYHAQSGSRENILPNHTYKIIATMKGSKVSLSVDGVNVLSANLPFYTPRGQTGIWAIGSKDILIKRFDVETQKQNVFAIMQFSSPFDELYSDVIKKVCQEKEFDLEITRADETYGNDLIISDITKMIIDSSIIIADVTPENMNVYYEVGYSHALEKPTILIAEKSKKLPFDLSPFRTLFYENSISGKEKIEKGLRNHLRAILNEAK